MPLAAAPLSLQAQLGGGAGEGLPLEAAQALLEAGTLQPGPALLPGLAMGGGLGQQAQQAQQAQAMDLDPAVPLLAGMLLPGAAAAPPDAATDLAVPSSLAGLGDLLGGEGSPLPMLASPVLPGFSPLGRGGHLPLPPPAPPAVAQQLRGGQAGGAAPAAAAGQDFDALIEDLVGAAQQQPGQVANLLLPSPAGVALPPPPPLPSSMELQQAAVALPPQLQQAPLRGVPLLPPLPGDVLAAAAAVKAEPQFATPGAGLPLLAINPASGGPAAGPQTLAAPFSVAAPGAGLHPTLRLGIAPLQAPPLPLPSQAAALRERQLQALAAAQPPPQAPPPASLQQALAMLEQQERGQAAGAQAGLPAGPLPGQGDDSKEQVRACAGDWGRGGSCTRGHRCRRCCPSCAKPSPPDPQPRCRPCACPSSC